MNSQSQNCWASRGTGPTVAIVCFFSQVEFCTEGYAGRLLAQHSVTVYESPVMSSLWSAREKCDDCLHIPSESFILLFLYISGTQTPRSLRSPQSRASSHCHLSSYQILGSYQDSRSSQASNSVVMLGLSFWQSGTLFFLCLPQSLHCPQPSLMQVLRKGGTRGPCALWPH
jgi:hypothetical protein